MCSVKYTANLKSICPSRKCPHSLSKVRYFLWLLQHLQTSCQALCRLIQPLLAWRNPWAWKVVFWDRDGDQDGKGGRFFSSHQGRKRCPSQRGPGLIFIPLTCTYLQAGLPRLQKDPPVQRPCLTWDQTEAQGLRVRTKQPSHQSASASRIRVGALGAAGDWTIQETGPPLAPL